MGTIALNQIISIGLTLEENVNIMFEILYCESLRSIDDDFSFDQKGWEKCFSNLMK